MNEPAGYFNGQLLPASQVALPLSDSGLTNGVLLAEQLRTIQGVPHLVDRHVDRLLAGCRTMGFKLDGESLGAAIEAVVRHNRQLVAGGSELRISVLATPGTSIGDYRVAGDSPTLIVTTRELTAAELEPLYRDGIHLASTDIREIPASSIPRHVKHRNRMHYWLAEQEAQALHSGARALIRDNGGNVLEGSTAAISIVAPDGRWLAPPGESVLPSITLEFSRQLMRETVPELSLVHQTLTISDLARAREILWFSTPVCVCPVTRLDDRQVGNGQPGPVFKRIARLWMTATGVQIPLCD